MKCTITLTAALAQWFTLAVLAQAPSSEPAPAAPPAAPQQPVRVMGKLLKVEGKDLVISGLGRSRGQEVRVTIDEDDAAIRLEGEPAALADLKPGMTVDVAETPPRDGPAGRFRQARFNVMAQLPGFTATVVKVDGKNVVANRRQPDGTQAEVTVRTDDQTRFRRPRGGGDGKLEDLNPNDRVYVKPDTGTAVSISLLPPPNVDALGQSRTPAGTPLFAPRVRGTLVKVEGKSIVVRPAPGRLDGAAEDMTFATDENTHVSLDAGPGKLEALEPGMTVEVSAGGPGKAAERILGMSPQLTGQVVRVDGANLVLRRLARERRGEEVTVATDDKTRITYVAGIPRTPKAPTLADLEPDMLVGVVPETGTARTIIVVNRAGPPQP